jgi:hypothetical protein
MKMKFFVAVYSHQHHFSVVATMHVVFPNSDNIRKMSKSCTHLVLMDTPRDRSGPGILSRQIFRNDNIIPMALQSVVDEDGRYAYIFIDIRPGVPNYYRLRTGIFVGEKYTFFPAASSSKK